jgi:hypothetical protein
LDAGAKKTFTVTCKGTGTRAITSGVHTVTVQAR